MNTTRRRLPLGARGLAVAVLVAAAFGTLLLPGSATATAPVIDEEQPIIDTTAGITFTIGGISEQKLAQVVTPALTGSLTEVRFAAACLTDLDVEVQGVSGGVPNGTVLGHQSVPFGPPLPTTFRAVAFSTPVPVTAGVPYALVLTTPVSCDIWPGPVGDPYQGGNGFFSWPGGGPDVWWPLSCWATSSGSRECRPDLPFQTLVNVAGTRLHHVAIEFVADWGGLVTRWEGDVATGSGDGDGERRTLEWLAADAGYGDPAVTLTADLRSRHVGRLMIGSLTATRGNARIQFRNVITPFALAADGTITTPFPIPATLYDGRNSSSAT